jgi:hypothetical protein
VQVAIEVAQADQTALFGVRGTETWVMVFDDNTVMVQAAEGQGPCKPVRARLLRSDGTVLQLRLLDQPARAVPRPGIVVNDFVGRQRQLPGVLADRRQV